MAEGYPFGIAASWGGMGAEVSGTGGNRGDDTDNDSRESNDGSNTREGESEDHFSVSD